MEFGFDHLPEAARVIPCHPGISMILYAATILPPL